MAFYNPVRVELYDADDNIIGPITRPISVVQNLEAFDACYDAIYVDTFDPIMRTVLDKWNRRELIQVRVSSRAATRTSDLDSIYAYHDGRTGEFVMYTRSHSELLKGVLAWPNPANAIANQTNESRTYTGSAGRILWTMIQDNWRQGFRFPGNTSTNIVCSKSIAQLDATGTKNMSVTVRFDSIWEVLFSNEEDKGGARFDLNGNILYDIRRDFVNHRFIVDIWEPTNHPQALTVKSGRVGRWQVTGGRASATVAIVGGPGEKTARKFERVTAPYDQYRTHFEEFFEETNPEGLPDDPTDAQVRAALQKYGRGVLAERSRDGGMGFTINETESFYLGGAINIGDRVRVGLDEDLILDEAQQITKAQVTWNKDNGYTCTLTTPEVQDNPDVAFMKRLDRSIKALSTRTRRV